MTTMEEIIPTLLIKCDDSTKEFYKNHSTYHPGDVGLDLFCPQDFTVNPGETVWLDLGIKCEMVDKDVIIDGSYGGTNIPFFLFPRSSISKTPLRLANSTGIFDAGYRGSVIAALDNIKDYPYTIKRGDRLVQICAPNLSEFNFMLVDTLSSTQRGVKCFGSTGL